MNSNEIIRNSFRDLLAQSRNLDIVQESNTLKPFHEATEREKEILYMYYLNTFHFQHMADSGNDELKPYAANYEHTFLYVFAENYCKFRASKSATDSGATHMDISDLYFEKPDDVPNTKNNMVDESYLQYFNLMRIELLKTLYFVDSLVQRICDYNIDKSVLQYGFSPAKAREALLWLMCKANPADRLDVQDINRMRTFFRVQINKRRSQIGRYYDTDTIDREYKQVMSSLDVNRSRAEKVQAVSTFKGILENLINNVFLYYDRLSQYRTYVIDMVPNKMENYKHDIFDLQCAIILANTVKSVFMTVFCCYLKLPNLELGHTELSDGQLSRCDISHSNFVNSNLRYTQMDNAIASGSDFSICNFLMCNAKGATLNDCSFNYSNMSGMNLSGASMTNSLLDAVIFRDNQLDVSIEFAKELMHPDATANANWRKLGEDFDKRKQELQYIATYTETSGVDVLRDFAKALTKDSTQSETSCFSAEDAERLKALTYASSEDKYPHLLLPVIETKVEEPMPSADDIADEDDLLSPPAKAVQAKDEPKRNVTVFDEIFYQFLDKTKEMRTYCDTNVISRELLDTLRILEKQERQDKRAERFKAYGAICFKPTVLSGASLIRCSMPQCDLSHIDMTNTAFVGSDLSKAKGYYAIAPNSSFANANLIGGEFYESNFNNCNCSESNCINATFINCNLHAMNMTKATANGIAIVNMRRTSPLLSELLLPIDEDSTKRGDNDIGILTENVDDSNYLTNEAVDMTDSNWNSTSAVGAIFIGMKMDRSNFMQTDLSNSMFFNCAARWGIFTRADFPYGLLLGTSFHQSIFTMATLSQSRIFSCEFSGCRMNGLAIIGSRCDKAIFYSNDMTDANLSRSYFNNCIFRSCNFNALNISNCVFNHCTFYDIDFNNAIGVASVSFKECIFEKISSSEEIKLKDEEAPKQKKLNSIGDAIVEVVEKGEFQLWTTLRRR